MQFDHNFDFQLEAIQAVVDVFQGLRRFDSAFTLGDDTDPNLPEGESLSEIWLFAEVYSTSDESAGFRLEAHFKYVDSWSSK